MNSWEFNDAVTRRLAMWNTVNLGVGVLLTFVGLFRRPWLRGFGSQFIGWAVINLAIALFGSIGTQNRRQRLADAESPERLEREARNIGLLLWVNAGLDVLYMLGGRAWADRRGASAAARGMGHGIMVQGLFLFVFDVVHGLLVPPQGDSRRAAIVRDQETFA